MLEPGEALYVYGFVDSRRPPADPPPGVSVEGFGSIAAVLRRVGLDDFCGPGSEARLADPAWVGPRACEHAAVLEAAMRWSPVFPLGFATLFSGRSGVASVVDRNRASIEDFLRRVNGREEWAVQIAAAPLDGDQLELLALAAHPDWASLPPGTRYLRLRQSHGELLALARRRALAEMEELAEAICPSGAEHRRLPCRPADAEAEAAIGRWAVLIDRERAPLLAARVARTSPRAGGCGLQLQLSGPWPPFSFRPALGAAA